MAESKPDVSQPETDKFSVAFMCHNCRGGRKSSLSTACGSSRFPLTQMDSTPTCHFDLSLVLPCLSSFRASGVLCHGFRWDLQMARPCRWPSAFTWLLPRWKYKLLQLLVIMDFSSILQTYLWKTLYLLAIKALRNSRVPMANQRNFACAMGKPKVFQYAKGRSKSEGRRRQGEGLDKGFHFKPV